MASSTSWSDTYATGIAAWASRFTAPTSRPTVSAPTSRRADAPALRRGRVIGACQVPEIMVTTLVSQRTGEPMVQIEMPQLTVQLGVSEVEDLARNMVHACEAAITDAFLASFFRRPEFDMGADGAMAILREFREWREARIAKPPGGEWKPTP